MINHILNLISTILPSSRLFGLKRALYRLSGVKIGNDVKIANNIKIFSQGLIIVGHNVWIGRCADFTVPSGSRITIGDSCDIAPYVKLTCGSHLKGSSQRRAGTGIVNDINIGNGCWIGINTVILAGACIGDGTIIAAGSVVIAQQYPPNVLLAGVPARIVRTLDS